MKTSRRHELQTNQLADALTHGVEAVQPYSRAILAALVAIVVLLFAWGYLSAQNKRREADAWNEYFTALDDRDPRDVLTHAASEYAGTEAATWARLALADVQLGDGTQRLFFDKKAGRDELKQAAENYRATLHEVRQPLLLQRATYGLAQTHEALGLLDEARTEYRSLTDKWPTSALAAPATARAKDLERMPTKGFYDWFAKYEPPRPMANDPGAGPRPQFLDDPSKESLLKFPADLMPANSGSATGSSATGSSVIGGDDILSLPGSLGTMKPEGTGKPEGAGTEGAGSSPASPVGDAAAPVTLPPIIPGADTPASTPASPPTSDAAKGPGLE